MTRVRKAALLSSNLLLLTWLVLMVGVERPSAPNALLDYVNWTVCLILALALVWIIVRLGSLARRLAKRNGKPA